MNRILDVGYCLSVPEKNDGCFIIKDVLGKGASSVTYLAECNQTEHVLKECNPLGLHMHRDNDGTLVPDTELNKVKFEEYLFRFVDGASKQLVFRLTDDLKNTTSNIQAIYHANGTVYIDMTYFNGDTYDNIAEESLYDLLRRMKALAQVIGHYHDMGYLHLDVKPQNIYAIPETPEMVMMFDFDSVVPVTDVEKMVTLSYTDTWAAPEQKMAKYRHSICKATDLFAIGEIIFYRITERHSTADERFDFSKYDYNRNAKIFENVNAQVHSLLEELFHRTICISPSNRFQNAGELIALLEKIIPLADPQKPVLPHKNNIVPKGGFIGRDTELQDIHARLQQNPILFLHGIGGIGKSELAKQYAVRYQSEYDTVFFAPYDTDIVFLIANDSGITINNFSRAENEAVEKYYERKLKILKELVSENDGRILLIVDNLNTREDENIKVLFELGCRVLVTSRVDLGATFMRPQMEVKAFSDMAIARELFNQYYQFSEAEATDVDAIINLVQGHTLAIELIAKQVEAEWSTVHEIREKLESGGLSSIGDEDIDSVKDDDLSQNSAFGHIKALFDLTIFEKENKYNELYLLSNLSLIPFTGIDRRLFFNWCDLNAYGGKNCVANLIKSGWIFIDKTTQYISLHPLLSEVVLKNVSDIAIFEPFAKKYISHIRERESGENTETYMHCEDVKINKHFISLIKQYGFYSPVFGRLSCDIGGDLYTIHQWDDALKACELSTIIAKSHLDDSMERKVSMAQSLSQEALIKSAIGKDCNNYEIIRDSIEIYLESIKLFEELDDNHPIGKISQIATLYNYTGIAYEDIGEIENARAMYWLGIELYKRCEILDEDDYQGLGCLYNNLGNTYSENIALQYYLLAKDSHEKAGGMTHHMAMTLYHIADIYADRKNDQTDLIDSYDYSKNILAFFEEQYPDDVYMIGRSKHLLGKVSFQLSGMEFDEFAYNLLTEARSILIQFLPVDDPVMVENQKLIKSVRGMYNR